VRVYCHSTLLDPEVRLTVYNNKHPRDDPNTPAQEKDKKPSHRPHNPSPRDFYHYVCHPPHHNLLPLSPLFPDPLRKPPVGDLTISAKRRIIIAYK